MFVNQTQVQAHLKVPFAATGLVYRTLIRTYIWIFSEMPYE